LTQQYVVRNSECKIPYNKKTLRSHQCVTKSNKINMDRCEAACTVIWQWKLGHGLKLSTGRRH